MTTDRAQHPPPERAAAGDYMEVVAVDIQRGDLIRRGDHWWTVWTHVVDVPQISAPVVRFRCHDHNGEVREFSLPADLHLTIRRPPHNTSNEDEG